MVIVFCILIATCLDYCILVQEYGEHLFLSKSLQLSNPYLSSADKQYVLNMGSIFISFFLIHRYLESITDFLFFIQCISFNENATIFNHQKTTGKIEASSRSPILQPPYFPGVNNDRNPFLNIPYNIPTPTSNIGTPINASHRG